ncbi:GNAT family N-acetyltransferase [Rhizobium sp. YS-1r]|uniref:GNAT family N-acetyltransferase n=1 Tax=Neorhizobium phenanthreniclasticum TaxID=3157917 RepID=A0ABV0LUU4_9HYPH|nr:GNAT family N-acetyltransferase [Rhizobium sp. YS-1r]KGD85986.1 acetyltransferase [Rhizobium sp. YS-1r]
MNPITVLSVPVFSTLCNEGFRLRREVFIVEQNVPADMEFDADDLNAFHFVAIVSGEVCGTLRVIHADDYVRIGRVVVSLPWRGKGVASAMIRHAMEAHKDVRGNRFYLTAQSDKTAMYERFGFQIHGDEFFEVGIPHYQMRNF